MSVVTFQLGTSRNLGFYIVPREEFRGASVSYDRSAGYFRIVTVHGRHDLWIDPTDDENSGWRYESLLGVEVVEVMIKDFDPSIPVDVLWKQDSSGRWTRTENAR